MKKLWTKFKRWLIVKLGGYLEGPKTYKVEHTYGTSTAVRPICVCAVHKISGDHMRYASPRDIFDDLFEGLKYEIRKNEDLFTIDHSWDPITDEVIYRIVIKLIPNESKKEMI